MGLPCVRNFAQRPLVALSLLEACNEANGHTGISARVVAIGIGGANWRVIQYVNRGPSSHSAKSTGSRSGQRKRPAITFSGTVLISRISKHKVPVIALLISA